jgi:glycosyltransferase involved in cell wall biosynthesis
MHDVMRIALYFPSFNIGGMEKVNIALAGFFISRGQDCTLLVHSLSGGLRDSVPPGVRVLSLAASRTRAAVAGLIRVMRLRAFDILHANLPHSNLAALLAKAFGCRGQGLVLCYHNVLSPEFATEGLINRQLFKLAHGPFLGLADEIIAVSQGAARDVEDTLGLRPHTVRTIYNPFDLERIDALAAEPPVVALPPGDGSPVILGVGRFQPTQKDFATLIRAVALVRHRRSVRLMLIGDGPDRPRLEALAHSLFPPDAVTFLGWQKNPFPYMRQANLLALSSLHEGFGNVLVEAMACGTPVVSTDCPHGPSEILGDGRYGRLTPVGDHAALAEAILATLAEPLPSETLRAAAARFSIQSIGESYLALYNEIMAR